MDNELWDRREFAHLLRRTRRDNGLRQTDLATIAGLSSRTIGRLERGEIIPSAETLQRLCTALGTCIWNLWPQPAA